MKRTLSERANQLCSNPDCQRPTSGPHSSQDKSIILGIASHITAAAPEGKRFDATLTAAQRSAIENAIWLCCNCATLVDRDDQIYTRQLLLQWKSDHERSISIQMSGMPSIQKNSVEAPTLHSLTLDLATPMGLRATVEAGEQTLDDSKVTKRTQGLSNLTPVTASDLVKAGFRPERVHNLLKYQDAAIKNGNDRFLRFITDYVRQRINGVPRNWSAIIAGLPIIGEDIESANLTNLSKLVNKYHPYLSSKLKNIYKPQILHIMVGILAELQAFLDDAARAGGIPIVISFYPVPTWMDWLPWSSGWEREAKVEESLVNGCWSYGVSKEVVDLKIDLSKTWAGFLFEIVSRLPDPDRQKGKIIKNFDLTSLVTVWCNTHPETFEPKMSKIVRHPVRKSDHTLAAVYKRWYESYPWPRLK